MRNMKTLTVVSVKPMSQCHTARSYYTTISRDIAFIAGFNYQHM